MKGKKLFYFVLFFSLIAILYGCNEKITEHIWKIELELKSVGFILPKT